MLTTADKRAAFRSCTNADASSSPIRSMSAARGRCSISASRRWPRPAPALPGPSRRADNHVTVDDVCDHLTAICAAVDIPVNADFEDGFAHEPDKVGVNVARAVKTGVAGLSIEDFTGDAAKPLVRSRAGDRSHQGGAQGDRCRQSGVLLTGRCEAFLRGQKDMNLVIDRLTAYAEAGADCLYAPGISTKEEISAVVKAVHPKPVNLLVGAAGPFACGCGRARRAPHQRRRFAGADGLGRLHEGGKGDGGEGHVHRTRQRLFRRRTEQDVQLIERVHDAKNAAGN